MGNSFIKINTFNTVAFLILTFFSSCFTTKNSVYFTDIPDSVKLREIVPFEFNEPVIQIDDILNITIHTIDPQASAVVNQTAISSGSSLVGGQPVAPGFLVSKEGKVDIPMLGQIKLVNLTSSEAKDAIAFAASKYFKNPTVLVRFANYKVTVLGEVNRPATYTMPNEKVTLLDALGLAGDLTIYGKRENVLIVRDVGGKKQFARVNLNSSEVFKSPYFYLRQNDVIYVEPGKGKISANNSGTKQTIATAASILSLLVVLLTRL